MSSAALNELEQSLRDQLRLSESALADRLAALHAVDDELVTLRKQQDKYDKVENICAALEELDDMGAGDLFWDDAGENKQAQLDYARQQIGNYHEAIVEVETRRAAINEEIKQQDVQLDYLHYDLQDIIEQEEAANGEWVLERDDAELPKRALVMPWARGTEEDKRFRISLGSSVAAALLFIFLIGMVVIPLQFSEEEIVLDERIARLVLKERALPPPPPPAPEPEPVAEEEIPEAVPELVEEVPDEPVPASNEEPQVVQEKPDTREKVKTAGILAFRDSFASSSQLQESAKLGSDARVNDSGVNETGRPERKMVTSSAPGTSGGINLAEISRDFGGGGGQIDGVAVSRVASTIGSGDDIGSDRPLAAGAVAGRTDEEIQIVFDRYKASLYRLYNRELRRDPTLRGQLVLRLTIEPDGTVSLAELHSSSMDAPALADQVVERVKTFDFGAKEDIVAVTIIYPIDFLPAG